MCVGQNGTERNIRKGCFQLPKSFGTRVRVSEGRKSRNSRAESRARNKNQQLSTNKQRCFLRALGGWPKMSANVRAGKRSFFERAGLEAYPTVAGNVRFCHAWEKIVSSPGRPTDRGRLLQPPQSNRFADLSFWVMWAKYPFVRYDCYKLPELSSLATLMFSLRTWLVLVAFVCPVAADEPEKPKSHFDGLKYRSIGPATGGRTTRACGVPGDPMTYYVASAGGGVWKSVDGGVNFKPIFDDMPDSSIGSIAVAPSDPNVIYVGGGEANIRGNVQAGNGIYKSTDAGKSWKHVWKQVGQIGTMVIHPKNANIAFAAVLGHAFGPNAERGIFRTTDGGKSWEQVLKKDVDTGASDVAIDPNNPRVIFAGLWQTRRKPWDLISGGPGSGLHVSRDGGDNWEQLGPTKDADQDNGLPPGPWGKVCVAIAPSDPNRIYAMIEADKGGLYRTDDGGESWQRVSDNQKLRQRAWYFSTLTVHPTMPDVVYCPQVKMQKSVDGGKTFKVMKGFTHGDHHDWWIDPKDPRRMITAMDGGADISTDAGKSWRGVPLPIAQFYHIACDHSIPYRVMGCMQDMGTACGPSNSLNSAGILLGDWHNVGGGEAGFAVPDPTDPNIIYAGEYGGYISRYDHRTRQSRHVGVYPYIQSGHGAEDLKYRFQWTSPIVISKHDPKTVYHAANVLFKTTNGGQAWDKISGDLTRNDKNKQKWTGGPITGDNTGVEIYGTIFALAESPLNKKVLWAGSDDGLVHVSQDQSYTWKNVTANVPDLPDWGSVWCIEPSPHDEATAYLVVDAHRLDDYRPHVWKTTDFGETWNKITEGLPADEYIRVVREDPKKNGHLYAGSERQVWHSPDSGKTWHALKLNMPTVAITDLVVKDDDLVVGTQGRSIWILDDLTPIRQWNKQIGDKAGHAFPALAATRWSQHGPVSDHQAVANGKNPPTGASITYFLKEKSKKPLSIEVFNEKNERVVRLEGKEKKAVEEEDEDDDAPLKFEIPGDKGMNRFAWDFKHQGAELIPKAIFDAGGAKQGPNVAPGTYTFKIIADGKTYTSKVEVRLDPRVNEPRGVAGLRQTPQKIDVAPRVAGAEEAKNLEKAPWILRRNSLDLVREEAKEQEQFALRIRDDVTRITKAVTEIRLIQKQLKQHKELLEKDANAKAFLKHGTAIAMKLDDLEAKLHNPKAKVLYDVLAQKGGAKLYSQLGGLFGFASSGDGPPTQGMNDLADEWEKELGEHEEVHKTLKNEDLAKLNELARKLNVPMIWIPTPKK